MSSNTAHDQLIQRVETVENNCKTSCVYGMSKFTEYDKGISRIFDTLQKIQDALLGKIDGSSGLMEDIRRIKSELQKLDVLRDEITELKTASVEHYKEITSIKEHLKKPFKSSEKGFVPKTWERMGWIITGGAIVVGYLGNKLVDFILSKMP